jgi:NAD(P)-dependent dehydrogenase (short-subunit alcohol dehydrogenase family)
MALGGRVALVTGGGTGLGREVSLALAAAGCDVAVSYSRSEREARETAEAVRGLGRRSTIVGASAFRPSGSSIPYIASKAGLVMLTKALAEALAPEVQVNAVAPGWLETRWLERHLPPEARARALSGGGPPPADLGEVARAVVFLAETDSMTGQTLIIDRGQTLL